MLRKIIEIDDEACNGCGLCVSACHEGAIGLVSGKARLLSDDYCDGLGDCLPACPTGAISFVEREAAAYDEEAVRAAMGGSAPAAVPASVTSGHSPSGCPGSLSRFFAAEDVAVSSTATSAPSKPCAAEAAGTIANTNGTAPEADSTSEPLESQLAQWPVEIKLVPAQAPYFAGAHVLVAADCTAFAYADFHRRFMGGRTTVIGCPKLDAVDYTDKLAEIFARNDVASITVARMEVPCCGGLEQAARTALARSGKDVPFEVVTISTRGELL